MDGQNPQSPIPPLELCRSRVSIGILNGALTIKSARGTRDSGLGTLGTLDFIDNPRQSVLLFLCSACNSLDSMPMGLLFRVDQVAEAPMIMGRGDYLIEI